MERASREESEVVRVRMLGGFEVSVGSRRIGERGWRLRKAAGLVKMLALAPGHRLRRERTMDLLWPELGDRAAANNLHQALSAARRAIGSSPSAPRYLRLDGNWISLCPDGEVRVDVEAFEEAAATARRAREPAAHRAAVDLYAGDLLPDDPYEVWTEERRVRLRETYLESFVELAALHEERGEPRPAMEALREAISVEPAHEEAHAADGQEGRAMEQYWRLREALNRALGTEPGPRSRRLYEEISAGHIPEAGPSPASDTSPPQGPAGAPRLVQRPSGERRTSERHNLPAPRNSFVGRERELLNLKRDLAMTRLLTLTGAGGSGKTRLALEAARDLVGAYPDGVWLAELASLGEGRLVAEAVAEAVGVSEQPGRPMTETLADGLREKELLLFLDNCEHLVQEAAGLVDALLTSCPRLRVLATSREALGVAGEINHPVPPLSLPDPSRTLAVEDLEGHGSVMLFVERALYRPGAFALTRENAAAVAEVCRQLDGIPLAIELAAARVGFLAVEQISARLSDSLKLLTGGSRTATPRQKTLRGALDWGYDLLSEPEKILLGRLSVFAGGWTLEAAEAVGADPGTEPGSGVEEGDVLDLLSRLVDKSLVVAEAPPGGALRYRMLEPIRQYAREKLEKAGIDDAAGTAASPGEAEVVLVRHAAFYAALAEEAEDELAGPEQPRWLARLEIEHDNLRAALKRSLDAGRAELGLRLAAALWLFWDTRGHVGEGRGWLERAISAGSSAPPALRARALNGAGWVSMFYGDYGEAKEALEEGLVLFREIGDEEGVATCLTNLGFAAIIRQQDLASAPALFKEAMSLKPRLKNRYTIATLLVFEGLMVGSGGDWDRGTALHEEALALFREMRSARGLEMCLTNLGLLGLVRGDHADATARLQENLRLGRQTGNTRAFMYTFFGLAGVAAGGRPVRAAQLWGASEAVSRAANASPSPLALSATNYDGLVSAARAALGEEAFARAWAEGEAMPLEEAIEYALADEEPGEKPAHTTREPWAGVGAAVLSRREEEVAILMARGLTNRRIAESLGISARTVDGHAARVLKKLGLSSRGEVAARLEERPPGTMPG